jgi:ABC-type multidrug transport system fused ATPase/permease subunit
MPVDTAEQQREAARETTDYPAAGGRGHYLKQFWQFVKPYKRPLRVVYVLYLSNSLLNLLPAFSVRFYIDLMIAEKNFSLLGHTFHAIRAETPTSHRLAISLLFLGIMIAIIVAANTIGVFMWRLGTKSTEKVLLDIKSKIHNHINKLSLSYFHDERVGTIMTKAVGDVESISQMLKNSFVLVYQALQIVMAPFLMIALSPMLFLVVMAPVPLIVFAFRNIKIKLKPMYQERRQNMSLINSQMQEAITGVREVKAFNMEDTSQKAYTDINWRFYDLQNRIMRVFSFNHQLQYGAKDLATVLIAVCGGIFIILGIGDITVGVIAAFMGLAGYFFNPISAFLGFYDTMQRGLVSLERIIDFLNVEPDVKDKRDARILDRKSVQGAISYQGVGFSYIPGSPVLKDISFSVNPGEKVAIVGPSGSGKSTLLSLLLRFYDVDRGSICIDGVNIRDCTQGSVRANVGIVFQETFLFYGSLYDNLLYVNPANDRNAIVQACKAANIHDTIMELPDGYDTRVGERGVKLSGGQRQRVAIARVFLKDPAIVILDEATSAVDTVTESIIQESIDRMLHGRTAFIIAHRLSTIKNCDTIIALDNGSIAEKGTHTELLSRKKLYYELYQNNLFS